MDFRDLPKTGLGTGKDRANSKKINHLSDPDFGAQNDGRSYTPKKRIRNRIKHIRTGVLYYDSRYGII
jgi:hypothetical protein